MSTVRALFASAGLLPAEAVRWGTPVSLDLPGVYVVASTARADDAQGLVSAPISTVAVNELLDVRPELRLDGQRPTAEALAERLASMWLRGEPVLYIGMTDASVRGRVSAYYRTRLGARRPHAGGWPIKTLSNLEGLFVFVAPCSDPGAGEAAMIGAFSRAVPLSAVSGYCDPSRIMPFANLEFPQGNRKNHGITGAREPRAPKDEGVLSSHEQSLPPSPTRTTHSTMKTQRVTSKDIDGGRIRVPGVSKALLPPTRQRVRVELRGMLLEAAWDPRTGPDRERSGVLSVPRSVLVSLVGADERLVIELDEGVVRLL